MVSFCTPDEGDNTWLTWPPRGWFYKTSSLSGWGIVANGKDKVSREILNVNEANLLQGTIRLGHEFI